MDSSAKNDDQDPGRLEVDPPAPKQNTKRKATASRGRGGSGATAYRGRGGSAASRGHGIAAERRTRTSSRRVASKGSKVPAVASSSSPLTLPSSDQVALRVDNAPSGLVPPGRGRGSSLASEGKAPMTIAEAGGSRAPLSNLPVHTQWDAALPWSGAQPVPQIFSQQQPGNAMPPPHPQGIYTPAHIQAQLQFQQQAAHSMMQHHHSLPPSSHVHLDVPTAGVADFTALLRNPENMKALVAAMKEVGVTQAVSVTEGRKPAGVKTTRKAKPRVKKAVVGEKRRWEEGEVTALISYFRDHHPTFFIGGKVTFGKQAAMHLNATYVKEMGLEEFDAHDVGMKTQWLYDSYRDTRVHFSASGEGVDDGDAPSIIAKRRDAFLYYDLLDEFLFHKISVQPPAIVQVRKGDGREEAVTVVEGDEASMQVGRGVGKKRKRNSAAGSSSAIGERAVSKRVRNPDVEVEGDGEVVEVAVGVEGTRMRGSASGSGLALPRESTITPSAQLRSSRNLDEDIITPARTPQSGPVLTPMKSVFAALDDDNNESSAALGSMDAVEPGNKQPTKTTRQRLSVLDEIGRSKDDMQEVLLSKFGPALDRVGDSKYREKQQEIAELNAKLHAERLDIMRDERRSKRREVEMQEVKELREQAAWHKDDGNTALYKRYIARVDAILMGDIDGASGHAGIDQDGMGEGGSQGAN